MLFHVNLLSVFFSALAAFFIGFVWYSFLFKEPYMQLTGSCPEKQECCGQGMGPSLVVAFLLNFAMAFAFSYFVTRTHSASVVDAAKKALLVWGGFFVPTLASAVLWDRKPVKLFLINAGHYLAILLAISFIAVRFR